MEALKAIVSRRKGLSPVASTSSSTPFDLPLDLSKPSTASAGLVYNPDLARMAFLSNYPNATFSTSETPRLLPSTSRSEVVYVSLSGISQQVVSSAVTLQEIPSDEREIDFIFNPALLTPRVELVEISSPEASISPSGDS